jgi:hypothetical protein
MNFEKRKHINNWLKEISLKYEVNSFQYKGALLWPLLKNIMFFKALNDKTNADSEPLNFRKFSFRSLFRMLSVTFFDQSKLKVVFGTSKHFRYPLGGVLIDKYFHSMKAKVGGSFVTLDHFNGDETYRKRVDFPLQTQFTYEIRYLVLAFRAIFFRNPRIESLNVPSFQSILAEFNQTFGARLTSTQIARQIIYLYLMSRFFKRYFKAHQVEEVYVLCYYLTEMRAMTWAANELNLTCYDMQHGSQGSMHEAYNDFGSIPLTGYVLMPRKFWCWTDKSADDINAWARKTSYHLAISGGNTWHDLISGSAAFEGAVKGQIVLLTLQPIGDVLIEPYLIDAIRLSDPSLKWYVRLHPRQSQKIHELSDIFARHSLQERVNIQEAFDLPLPVLLEKSIVHLSKFSGSIEEAAEFNVLSLVLDEIGVNTYHHLIKEGKAVPFVDRNGERISQFINTYAGGVKYA